MLTNLVSNAIKFTPQGRIVVEARELRGAGQEGLLEFTVTDTGIGIAQDKCALLFRPFSQADSSTTREYGGTGLGLSIVRSLAEQMGGSVGFETSPGVGSRFWFRIRATPAAAADLNHDAHLRAPAPPAASMCGHVLVVEDNPINRKVLSALLTRMGLRVSLAENGAEGFDAVCRDASIDLVLIDVNMPVLDGIAATGKIRAWEQGQARVPIVALTADAFEADRQRCMDAGMNDFLAKPVVIKALREVLERWLPAAGAGAVRTGGPRAPDG